MKFLMTVLFLSNLAFAQEEVIPSKGPNFFSAGSVALTFMDDYTFPPQGVPRPFFQTGKTGRYSFLNATEFSADSLSILGITVNNIESTVTETENSVTAKVQVGANEISGMESSVEFDSAKSEVKITCTNRKPVVTTSSSMSEISIYAGGPHAHTPSGEENETFEWDSGWDGTYKLVLNEVTKNISGNKADVSVNAFTLYKVQDGTVEIIARSAHSRAYAECNK